MSDRPFPPPFREGIPSNGKDISRTLWGEFFKQIHTRAVNIELADLVDSILSDNPYAQYKLLIADGETFRDGYLSRLIVANTNGTIVATLLFAHSGGHANLSNSVGDLVIVTPGLVRLPGGLHIGSMSALDEGNLRYEAGGLQAGTALGWTRLDEGITNGPGNTVVTSSAETVALTGADLNTVRVYDAAADVAVTLPAGDAVALGKWATFHRIGAGSLAISAAGTDTIGIAGATISSTVVGQVTSITLRLLSETHWAVEAVAGVWRTT